MKTPESALFHLLSCVVKGTAPEASLFANMGAGEWDALYKLAKDQGVTALVFEKLESLPAEVAPPKQLMLQWFSHTLSIGKQMERKYIVAADFAERLAAANIPVVVLKGFAIAAYYPQPLHRECGDLDCYMLGKMAEGEAVAASFGAVVEEANYKHSHIKYKGLTIENHKYFTSFNNTARGKGTEAALKQLIFAQAPARWDNSALLRPNATFNALFLAKHALRHFIDEAICLRHIMDWALFLKAEAANVDWQLLRPHLEASRVLPFAQLLTRISLRHLGLPASTPLPDWLRGGCCGGSAAASACCAGSGEVADCGSGSAAAADSGCGDGAAAVGSSTGCGGAGVSSAGCGGGAKACGDGAERLARWEEILLADTFGGHPSMAGETFLMKCKRILRRFRRIYRFRDLADETPATLIWNAFAFSSYLHRKL